MTQVTYTPHRQGKTADAIRRLRPGTTWVVSDARAARRVRQMIATLRPDLREATITIKTAAQHRAEAPRPAVGCAGAKVTSKVFGQ